MTRASGLLNPPGEAAVCRRMIARVAELLATYEAETSSSLLERERYAVLIGKIEGLRQVKADLQAIYQREFEV